MGDAKTHIYRVVHCVVHMGVREHWRSAALGALHSSRSVPAHRRLVAALLSCRVAASSSLRARALPLLCGKASAAQGPAPQVVLPALFAGSRAVVVTAAHPIPEVHARSCAPCRAGGSVLSGSITLPALCGPGALSAPEIPQNARAASQRFLIGSGPQAARSAPVSVPWYRFSRGPGRTAVRSRGPRMLVATGDEAEPAKTQKRSWARSPKRTSSLTRWHDASVCVQ